MKIFYSPDGMPVQVPLSEEALYIRLGYRTSLPKKNEDVEPQPQTTDRPPAVSIGHTQSEDPPVATLPTPSVVNINTANLKEIATLPGVSTATARLVMNNRPFAVLEDLIANVKVESVDWYSLREQITFKV